MNLLQPVTPGRRDAARPERAPDGSDVINEILLCCSRTVLDQDRLGHLRRLLVAVPDWDLLFDECFRHGIFPLLQHHIVAIGPEIVPEPARHRFWDHMRSVARTRLLLTSEVMRLSAAFESAGIEMLLLKGAGLAMSAYGSLDLREFYDLDLLVRPDDLESSADILSRHGYIAAEDPSGKVKGNRPSEMHRSFHNPSLRTDVELHWTVTTPDLADPRAVDRWWGAVREIPVGRGSVRGLSPDHSLLMLCIHGARHDWARLRCIADVAESLRAEPPTDWDRLWREAEQAGCRLLLALGLLLAHELLQAPMPAAERERSLQMPSVAALSRAVPDWLLSAGPPVPAVTRNLHWFRLRLKPRLRDRLEYGWRYIVSNRIYRQDGTA